MNPYVTLGYSVIGAALIVAFGAVIYLLTHPDLMPLEAIFIAVTLMLPLSVQVGFGVLMLRRGRDS